MSVRAPLLPFFISALVGGLVAPVLTNSSSATVPIDSAVPSTTPPAEPGGVTLELVGGLGAGGQPDNMPREIVIAEERFLFDRIVPLRRQELNRVAQEAQTIAYARSEAGPFPAVYVSVPDRSEDELARYLPEMVGVPDAVCPAEGTPADLMVAGEERYAPAGPESDLTPTSLEPVGDVDGVTRYADPGTEPPFPELFVESDEQLLRHVRIDASGRPTSLAVSLAFNGAELGFDADVTDVVDPAALTKVGCTTAFPVYAPAGEALDAVTGLYVVVANRYFRFVGESAATPTDPTEAPPADSTAPETTPLPETTTIPETTTTTTTVPETTTTTTTVPETTTTIPESTSAAETTAPAGPAARTCAGDPGAPDAQGIPNRLPTRFHLDDRVYLLAGVEAADAVGALTSTGCLGPFETLATDQAADADVIYLRLTDAEEPASLQVYRFEAGLMFQIDVEVALHPQVITAGDASYLLRQVWQPLVYSSTSVVLFGPDSEDLAPGVIYAQPISDTVRSDVIGEYRMVDDTSGQSDVPAAEETELNPDLTIDGQEYVLVAVYPPIGTTQDGFVTLFGTRNGDATSVVVGRDQRSTELLTFEPDA